MKNSKKEVVVNFRQAVMGITIIATVVCVMATIVGIVFGDSHLLSETSTLAAFSTILFCMNYVGAKKEKEAKEKAEA